MHSSLLGYASVLALASLASAQTSYPANTNTGCGTQSDVDYQGTYYYPSDDTMDWGLYTQSTGTCDAGSYAKVHMTDPSGNDVDCGYVALNGNLNLVSCTNYPRGYMTEGQYTLYWETTPNSGQYSWNQFTVTHVQAIVTAPVPTSSITTTPLSVITSTITNTPTETVLIAQKTITTPSATVVNTVLITPPVLSTTITTTSYLSLTVKAFTIATTTAYTTAPCKRQSITIDKIGSRATTKKPSLKITRESLFDILARIKIFRREGDKPNTVGMVGPPLTSTTTPAAVISTITAATSTSTLTSTTNAPAVTITSLNPTPTITVYSGQAVQTVTITLPQSTKTSVKVKAGVTIVTSTSTLYITKKVVTTPVCAPTGV